MLLRTKEERERLYDEMRKEWKWREERTTKEVESA